METPPIEAPERAGSSLLVVIPVYNDWDSATELLNRLEKELSGAGLEARYLVVDDGSSSPAPPDLTNRFPRADILELRRNLGHQRAIAVALCWAQAERRESALVVMDGDGEDDPADVPRLVAAFRAEGERKVVFAERRRRSENAVFVAFYHAYRAVHWLLTGQSVRVGNFSVMPRSALDRLVVVPELWNHYAAAVFWSKLPRTSIPTTRATRLAGRSRLSFSALVVHGLSAISVYREIVAVRVLCATMATAALVVAGLVAVVGIRLFTTLAVPGWATFTAGLLLVVLTQVVVISLVLILMMLSGRQASTFLPIRDYAYFIASVRRGSGADRAAIDERGSGVDTHGAAT
jgi:glycosyltransferase involved in cell wall biosynthesis